MTTSTPIPQSDRTYVLSETVELNLRYLAEHKGLPTNQALESIITEYALTFLEDQEDDEEDDNPDMLT